MCWLALQGKRKYLDASEVPEWMRFSKKELEDKQKQVSQRTAIHTSSLLLNVAVELGIAVPRAV